MDDHTYYGLGYRNGDTVISVTPEEPAYVRVMPRAEYPRYRAGDRYRYLGGYVETWARIRIPRSGHWVAVVDRDGDEGDIKAKVRVLRRGRGGR